MFNSFSSALSSLRAHTSAVDTVGHNLANVNTTGFKANDVAFKEMVAQSMGAGRETGMGVGQLLTIRNFSQGAIQPTSGSLDAAIQGNGFFVLKDSTGAQLLTRDGGFQLDPRGFVVSLTGERVQQYTNGVLADIQIPSGALGPSPTSTLALSANLDATSEVDAVFSTPVEIVDSLGVTHVLTFEFTKTDVNTWNCSIKVAGADVGSTDPVEVGTTSITFDSAGNMTDPAAVPGTVDISITGLASGAADLAIKWDMFMRSSTGVAGKPTLTQYAQASAPSGTSQDGFTAGEVVSVGMGDGGRIIAKYGNGKEQNIATLAVSLVANASTLVAAGNNNFLAGPNTAQPVAGIAETGGRGKVKAGALEASTVDIAREFTNLIVFQRGYQANSRVITTADELSQETLNLKR